MPPGQSISTGETTTRPSASRVDQRSPSRWIPATAASSQISAPAVRAARALGISFGDRTAEDASSGVFTSEEDREFAEQHHGEHLLDEAAAELEAALSE